ncbi:MAG: type II toxin-antitoxin system RelE/ParE family toxin [Nitrospirae bacterium]|nr:type II toxin-antitoxin system RelE/ParE family toxin [Nitrospirota bacterium]
MNYSISILRPAQKQLAVIDVHDRIRIITSIYALADNPRPPGCRKMSGRPAWRIRIGIYRIIYEINDSELSVLVVAVGHRKDVYN